MIVYVVVSGEYSDKGIRAVFVDKDKAVSYCAARNDVGYDGGLWDDYRIEEYDTQDASLDSGIEYGYMYHYEYNDTVKRESLSYRIHSKSFLERNDNIQSRCVAYYGYGSTKNLIYETYCWLKTEDKSLALKICRDKLAVLKTQKEGI